MSATARQMPSLIVKPATWPRRVLLLHENLEFGGDLDESLKDGLEQNGCEVLTGQRKVPWSADVDAVLGYGPFSLRYGDMLPAGRNILGMSPGKRPAYIWILTEGVPDPRIPHSLVDPAARMRLLVDQMMAGRLDWLPTGLRSLLLQGHRLRILGQLQWLERNGVLTCLGVTSESRAQYLRRHHLRPMVTPLGYHPVYGTDLHLPRDVDVAFLGNLDSPRRKQILPGLFAALERCGVKVNVQTALYGESRTHFLNRCRIILNVLRADQDFVGQRFLLAAANKTLIVSEPLNDSAPFIPGRHLIVSSLERLPDTVCEYLRDEARRSAITEAAYSFVTHDWTVNHMVEALLAEARGTHQYV